MHEAAREQVITIAILEFIPMEQHDAVTQRMEDVTRAYYDSIGLGEAYQQMEAMNGLSMPIDVCESDCNIMRNEKENTYDGRSPLCG